MKRFLTLMSASCLFTVGVALADMAFAIMVAQREFSNTAVLSHFEAQSKNTSATADLEMAEMIRFANETMGVKSYYTHGNGPGSLTVHQVKNAIIYAIRIRPKWDHQLPANGLKSLSSQQDLLKKHFGNDSYEWAWVLNQQGDKKTSKAILTALFEKQHKYTLSQTEFVIGLDGETPLREINSTYDALTPMLETNEKTIFEAKMQQAKKHVSNSPQSQIMT